MTELGALVLVKSSSNFVYEKLCQCRLESKSKSATSECLFNLELVLMDMDIYIGLSARRRRHRRFFSVSHCSVNFSIAKCASPHNRTRFEHWSKRTLAYNRPYNINSV